MVICDVKAVGGVCFGFCMAEKMPDMFALEAVALLVRAVSCGEDAVLSFMGGVSAANAVEDIPKDKRMGADMWRKRFLKLKFFQLNFGIDNP